MAKTTKPLSDTQIAAAKPQDKAYNLYDGGGLIVDIRTTGSKFWRYKYKNPLNNTDAKITLGEYPALSLAAARKKRVEFETMRVWQDERPVLDAELLRLEVNLQPSLHFDKVGS